MSNAMKSIVFIISLIAYFIYLSISSAFIRVMIEAGSMSLAVAALYISSGLGILVVLFTQAALKYFYASRPLRNAVLYLTLPMGKSGYADRIVVYFLPALAFLAPVVQTKTLEAVTPASILFLLILVLVIEIVFFLNSKIMKAYITDKGIILRGIDIRLELPVPASYRNPSGFFSFDRIISFHDLNDRLILEQSYDMGIITLKGDAEALRQIKGLLLANKVRQKVY